MIWIQFVKTVQKDHPSIIENLSMFIDNLGGMSQWIRQQQSLKNNTFTSMQSIVFGFSHHRLLDKRNIIHEPTQQALQFEAFRKGEILSHVIEEGPCY